MGDETFSWVLDTDKAEEMCPCHFNAYKLQ